ncbi:MAG TPA: hypothetical protein VNT26_07805, partial [Candidatus Sulfotelmatobacter sp.]|nr:hypothetical protein [Candidatus Sulfotelmatobacter sp.]
MKPRWLVLSVSLNLLLLGVVGYAARHTPGAADARSTSVPLTHRALRATPKPALAPQPQPSVAQVEEPFHWSQLESEDYRVYAANLRAIGCPESTVGDIVEADVNKLFHRRVKELVDLVQPRFWQLVCSEPALEEMTKEKEAELETLEKQRDALLEEVLGKAQNRRSRAAEQVELEQVETRKQFLDFLPPDKLAQCLALETRYRQLLQETSNAAPPLADKERQARIQALLGQQEREFRGLLSQEELSEYLLRSSRFADLRLRLAGFEATEQELKQIIRTYEQAAADPAKAPPAERHKQEREALRGLLGEERFAEFGRAQDQHYQELRQVANRFELPAPVAEEAYAMRQAAEEQARRIRQDQTLPADQRLEQLKAIRVETERSV